MENSSATYTTTSTTESSLPLAFLLLSLSLVGVAGIAIVSWFAILYVNGGLKALFSSPELHGDDASSVAYQHSHAHVVNEDGTHGANAAHTQVAPKQTGPPQNSLDYAVNEADGTDGTYATHTQVAPKQTKDSQNSLDHAVSEADGTDGTNASHTQVAPKKRSHRISQEKTAGRKKREEREEGRQPTANQSYPRPYTYSKRGSPSSSSASAAYPGEKDQEEERSMISSGSILGKNYYDTVNVGLTHNEEVRMLRLASELMSAMREAACTSYSSELEKMRKDVVKRLESSGPLPCATQLRKMNSNADKNLEILAQNFSDMETEGIREAMYAFNRDTINATCKNGQIDPIIFDGVMEELIGALCDTPSGTEAASSVVGLSLYPTTLKSQVLIKKAKSVSEAVQQAACDAYARKIHMVVALYFTKGSKQDEDLDVGKKKCSEMLQEVRNNEQRIQKVFPGANTRAVHDAMVKLYTEVFDKLCVNDRMNKKRAVIWLGNIVASLCPEKSKKQA